MGNDSERQCFINMYVFSSNYVYLLMPFGRKTAGGLGVRISITRDHKNVLGIDQWDH